METGEIFVSIIVDLQNYNFWHASSPENMIDD